MRTLTLKAIAAVVLVFASAACGSDDPQTREARCERWVFGIVDSVDEPSDEVERLIAGAFETEFLCYEAKRRGALTDEGKIEAMRVEEVIRCSSDHEQCAPRELASLVRSDPRVARLAPAARLVLLEGLVALSDYDGVVQLDVRGESAPPWRPS